MVTKWLLLLLPSSLHSSRKNGKGQHLYQEDKSLPRNPQQTPAYGSSARTVAPGPTVGFIIRNGDWVRQLVDGGAIHRDKKYRGGTGLLGAGVAVNEFSLGHVTLKSL